MSAFASGGFDPINLGTLAPLPLWVGWQKEIPEDKNEPTKMPYLGIGRRAMANGTKWLCRSDAERLEKLLPKPFGIGGIGIEFATLTDGRAIAGVDLDSCRNSETGQIENWALGIIEEFNSYTEVSPSGTGAKIFFTYSPENLPQLRKAMGGSQYGKMFKREGGEHPPAIELHLGNRYFATTGLLLDGMPTEFRHIDVETLLRLIRETGPKFVGVKTEQKTDRSRSAAAFRKGKELRRAGASFDEMVAGLLADPETADWTREKGTAQDNRELKRIWAKAAAPDSVDGFDLTEDGIALAFAKGHQDLLRYDHSTGRWFQWTGKAWRQDETKLAFSWSRRTCRQLAKQAGAEDKLLATLAKAATAAAVERFAQSDPALAVTSAIWDRDPFLLGTPGGTLDLRTAELRDPVREDYITKLTSVTPSVMPDCPLWLAFLDQVTEGDAGLIRFLKQWCGYSLTGDIREHALMFAHGPGGNGKGVFLNVVRSIMGEYACNAAMDTFTASQSDKHSTDLAMLRGARLVTASETEEGRAWAEARIKTMTGGDPITARFMRQDNFTFQPQFKLTIIGNHKPVLRNVDDAARRRFNMVPFLYKPPAKDKELEAKLLKEAPGILRWMIEGCLDWQMNGLIRPRVVIQATADYFSEQDIVNQWVEECCVIGATQSDALAILFKSWSDYALANGEKTGTTKWFSQTLTRMGCTAVRHTPGNNGKRGFMGIATILAKSWTHDAE